MRIGIIGSGTVGMALAARLANVGHGILVANSRGPESLRDRLAEIGSDVTAGTVAEAGDCEIVVLALPWSKVRDVLTSVSEWSGRILVDATNIFLSYAPDFRIDDLKGDSGSEIVARLAPSARVVKAFNTLPFATMFAPADPGLKRVLFVAGDDASAVATVAGLVADLGLRPVPLGPLATAGRQMEVKGPLSGLELLAPVREGAAS